MIKKPKSKTKPKQTRLQKEEYICQLEKDKWNGNFLILGPVLGQDGKNYDIWQFKFKGKDDTAFKGGFYDVKFYFPPEYPEIPPEINFENGFQHMQVTRRGSICLPIVDRSYWQMSTEVYDIACQIYNMIHGPPNPIDVASLDMQEKYQNEGPEAYYEHLRKQAVKFSQFENYLIQQ